MFSTQLNSFHASSAITSICLDPRNQNIFVFQKDDQILVLDKSSNESQSQKKKKMNNQKVATENYSIKTIKNFSTVNNANKLFILLAKQFFL